MKRAAILVSLVTTTALSIAACSDDTASPTGPLPGDVISADASASDFQDASMIDLDATSNVASPDATTVTARPDAASMPVFDAATPVDEDAAVDDDF